MKMENITIESLNNRLSDDNLLFKPSIHLSNNKVL